MITPPATPKRIREKVSPNEPRRLTMPSKSQRNGGFRMATTSRTAPTTMVMIPPRIDWPCACDGKVLVALE
jgi:hypothetical protein